MRLQEVLCEFTELHWFCHRCDKITIKIIHNFNDETTTITPTPTTDETTLTSNIIASISYQRNKYSYGILAKGSPRNYQQLPEFNSYCTNYSFQLN